jgi:hypothetical protein
MMNAKGQSLLELCLIIPVLFLLLFGGIEVGLSLHNWLVVSQAARSGARVAARGGTDQEVRQIIYENTDGYLLNTLLLRGRGEERIEITPGEEERRRGDEVKVRIGYEIFLAIPWWGELFHLPAPAFAVMKMERLPRGGPGSIGDIIPICITPYSLIVGEEYKLKYGGGEGSMGNYGCLALGGEGSTLYEENITYGYGGELKVGDIILTEPGNNSGPTNRGINARISGHEDETYSDYSTSSPRVVTIPIVDHLPEGRAEVRVIGFGKFFLEEVGGAGNNCYIVATYLGDGG